MALTNLHPLDPATAYLTERGNLLKQWENDPLFRHSQSNTVTPQDRSVIQDIRGFLAIGYGLDLLHNSPQAIANYFIAANIQLLGHTGVGLSAADIQLIINYQADPLNNAQALLNGFPALPSEAAATALLNVRVGVAENQLDQILGSHMQESRERAVLTSFAYNNAGALLGPKLVAAIQGDQRAEAWYEIRYGSNGGQSHSQGIANRRYAESDLFGLYKGPDQNNATPGQDEAKSIIQVYTTHRDQIRAYETEFSPLTTIGGVILSHSIDFNISFSRTRLIADFAQFAGAPTIDGEVLVGQNDLGRGDILEGTASGDLIFGEQGNDVLRGGAGTDVLYGGAGIDTLSGGAGNDLLRGEAGADTLQGGAGDDRLEGGAGFDTYIYNVGDGTDQIEDSDATGQIIFAQKLLQAGIRRTGDAVDTYTSLDGTQTYVLSGGHLLVNGVLTVKANFQSGQFGIHLRDVSEANYDNGYPETTSPDVLGLVNNIVHYGGGDDVDFGERGNDQLFGEDGNDALEGNTGDDRLSGGAGNDFLRGDNVTAPGPAFNIGTDAVWGRDVLDGGDGDDTLIGDWGDDILRGGAGIDLLYGDSLSAAQGTASANDFLDGGEGNDELHGQEGDDVLYGGAGNDFLSGEDGNDVEDGGAGDDLIFTYLGNDSLAGGAGVDQLYGDVGNDILDGGDDADTLYGGDGSDQLYGGRGADILLGDHLNNPSEFSTEICAEIWGRVL